jgi:hypothetical protein
MVALVALVLREAAGEQQATLRRELALLVVLAETVLLGIQAVQRLLLELGGLVAVAVQEFWQMELTRLLVLAQETVALVGAAEVVPQTVKPLGLVAVVRYSFTGKPE